MQGYFMNKEETEKTIDEQGWLHTGDIGYIDDDGDIFIVDRIKELIKYKGFQVKFNRTEHNFLLVQLGFSKFMFYILAGCTSRA